MNSLNEIAQALKEVKRAMICGHVMPDGDCLGSSLALAMALKHLGKEVTVVGRDPVPEIYRFLPGSDGYYSGPPPTEGYDTLIVVDCPVKIRMGRGYRDLPDSGIRVIAIDHHATREPFGDYRYTDPKVAAVGEIIYRLLGLLQIEITVDMAICLYTAIVTDTGSFQYENTTKETHLMAAELMKIGAPLLHVNTLLYEEKSKETQLLLKEALNTLAFSDCGQVAWMKITRDMLRDTQAKDEHTEGLVNYARSIRGVEVGILFHQLEDGKIKIGFRSKNWVDVNKLAQVFNGGGHIRASGCKIEGEMDRVVSDVVKEALKITATPAPN